MTRLLSCLVWIGLALVAGGQPSAPEVRTWTALADREWSPAALRVRRAESARWTYLEGARFVVAGRSLRQLESAAREIESVHQYFQVQLGKRGAEERLIVLLVGEAGTWSDLTERSHLRTDGESLQVGREIFILATNTWPAGRVAHEVVHCLVRPHGGPRIPLWMEEGLALRWGWDALRQAGLAPPGARQLESIPESDLLAWDALLSATDYPASPRAAQAFYRQAEELAAGLAEALGERGLAAFAHDLAHRAGDCRVALAARQWDDAKVAAWQAGALARCRERRVVP